MRRVRAFRMGAVSLIAVAVSSASCSTSTSTTSSSVAKPAARASFRYLAIGDSFTIGTGSGEEEAFPAVFAQTSACRVDLRNVARNGFTTLDVMQKEVPVLRTFHPDFVTLAIGANDFVQGRSLDDYRKGVKDILGAILEAGVKPERIVLLPQPRWDRSPTGKNFGAPEDVRAAIEAMNGILKEEGARIGARWLALEATLNEQADAGAFASDGLHPNAASHAAWAMALDALVCPP